MGSTFNGIRKRPVPVLFIYAGLLLMFFYVILAYYYPETTAHLSFSFPAFCANGSCHLESKEVMWLVNTSVSSLRNGEANANNTYLVNTSGCKLLEVDAFHPSAPKLSKPGKPHKCDHRIATMQGDKLIVDMEYLQTLKSGSVQCCYRGIYRVTQNPAKYDDYADDQIKFSEECHDVPPDGIIVQGSPFVKLECNWRGEFGRNVGAVEFRKHAVGADEYRLIREHAGAVELIKQDDSVEFGENGEVVEFHGIPLHPKKHSEETRKKAEYWEARKEKGLKNPPSVLVIGIDSTSRLHMIRSMPRTRKFLLQNDFIEMKGYTRVGKNTFPNIMAGLGGMELDNYNSCWPDSSKKLDDCPFIWKDFSKLNYLTGIFEDSPKMAIFHYLKLGFVLRPVDYYLRPLALAFTRHFKGTRQENCAGGVNVTDFIAKFIRDLVAKMGKNFPYFLFSWFTSATHDGLDGAGGIDGTFLELFKTAMDNSTGDPDNTVIVFMSDHGYRHGMYRESIIGFYEENLPFFYFRLPPSMKRENPEWYSNLVRNSNQLTSPLDFHSTLLQIVAVAQRTMASNDSVYNNKTQQNDDIDLNKQRYSFLERIPENRTCEVSGIPTVYCMCGVTPEVSSSTELSSQMRMMVISRINSLLRKNFDICQPLNFSKLLYGRELASGQLQNKDGQVYDYKDYVFAVETVPGEGHFESKIRIFHNSSSEIVGDIQRINSYEGQSECIQDYNLRNFCYCNNLIISQP